MGMDSQNMPLKTEEGDERKAPKAAAAQREMNAQRSGMLILYSIAGVVILAFIAIAVGLTINGGGPEIKAWKVFTSWVEEIDWSGF